MFKIKINKGFESRYSKFMSSKIFNTQNDYTRSGFWNYHRKQIQFSYKNSVLNIKGRSGYNPPEKKGSPKFIKKILFEKIKKILNINQVSLVSYKQAFNEVMNDKSPKGFQQIIFDENKIVAKNFQDCKKKYPFSYEINERTILSYYFINILNSYIDFSKVRSIVEIGAGTGHLMHLIKHYCKTKCIIDIDLPEVLIHTIPLINSIFPNLKILLPNEINDKINTQTLEEYDFIFVTPSQINLISDNLIDLFITTGAFAEMTKQQIDEYFKFIQRSGENKSFFFNVNRVEKIPFNAEKLDEISKIEPIRFAEYPFYNNEVIIYELSKFYSAVQRNPVYIRLEKILK